MSVLSLVCNTEFPSDGIRETGGRRRFEEIGRRLGSSRNGLGRVSGMLRLFE